MDIIAQFKDREIAKVIDPTVTAFAPLLKAKKAAIRAVPMRSFKYGDTDRHQLDVYYPLTDPEGANTTNSNTNSKTKNKTPILFFIYGGGFNTGERSISPKTFGLVYACVGAFYARRGYIVVIPDYRLVPHVVFPGPAEDVRDALRWAVAHPEHLVWSLSLNSEERNPEPDLDRIAIMGHSAGAAHVATMLFHDEVLGWEDELRKRIVGAILESPPYDLSAMTDEWPTAIYHAQYWGTLQAAKDLAPMYLYRRLTREQAAERLPEILMVEGEREPEWLIDAGELFQEEVRKKTGKELKKIVAKGHNHISLNWALSTGVGEDWAEEVTQWLADLMG